MALVDKESLKDISMYIRSIAPSSIEGIAEGLGLQGMDKAIWILRYRDKVPIEEVAERLHISIATVNRTILRLKTMIVIEMTSRVQSSDEA